jgi:chorismate mutase
MDSRLNLARIRENLISLEDNILISLFMRSRFKLNDRIYVSGGIAIPGVDSSFFEFLFRGTENLHALAGRYADPEEHPFYEGQPAPIVSRRVENRGIEKRTNFNRKILEAYFEALHSLCEEGDDNNYGNSAICDITGLQNISKRVHIGEQVAESKIQKDFETYAGLVKAGNPEPIMDLLTDKSIEEEIYQRVRRKGEKYGIKPEFIVAFYRDKVIPLTKEVEVRYILKRFKN